MKKALITGGAGFVGTALIKKLLRKYKDIEIVSIDNYSSGKKSNHNKSKRVTYLTKDTTGLVARELTLQNTKMDLADAFEPEVVFHFGEFSRIVTSFDKFDVCWEYTGPNKIKVGNQIMKKGDKTEYILKSYD